MVQKLHERTSYRPDIQGLRGVAVLLVVLYHAGLPVHGGYIGVDVFFVISGFVIARGIVRKLNQGTFSFRQFYGARFRRLLPALAVTLSVASILNLFLGPLAGIRTSVGTALAASLFNANHYLMRGVDYFSAGTELNAFLHTWSLSVEEQFYFLLPATMWSLWRLGEHDRGNQRLLMGIAGIAILSLTSAIYFTFWGNFFFIKGSLFAFYSVFTRAWQFGVGILIALCHDRIRLPHGLRTILGWLGMAVIVFSAFLIQDQTPFPGYVAIPPTMGAALVILAGVGDDRPLAMLASSPMVRIGDLSYSWYLWHWPLMVMAVASVPKAPVVAAIVMIPVSYLAAIASERWIENPIRYRAKERRWPMHRLLSAVLLIPILLVGGAYVLFSHLVLVSPTGPHTPIQAIVEADHVYSKHPCRSFHVPSKEEPACTWNPGAKRKIALIGDSNAYQWSRALEGIAEELDITYTLSWRSACLFTPNFEWFLDGVPQTACMDTNRTLIKDLLEHPVDVVILSTVIDSQLEKSTGRFRRNRHEPLVSLYEDKAAIFHDGIHSFASQLTDVGTKVIFIDTVPKLTIQRRLPWWLGRSDKHLYRRCSVLALSRDLTMCGAVRRIVDNDYNDQQRASTVWEGIPSTRVIHTAEFLCPNGLCYSWDDQLGAPLYVDRGHLSYHGALLGRDALKEALHDALQGK